MEPGDSFTPRFSGNFAGWCLCNTPFCRIRCNSHCLSNSEFWQLKTKTQEILNFEMPQRALACYKIEIKIRAHLRNSSLLWKLSFLLFSSLVYPKGNAYKNWEKTNADHQIHMMITRIRYNGGRKGNLSHNRFDCRFYCYFVDKSEI